MTLVVIARVALGVLFAVAAIAKFADRSGWRRTLVDLAVPDRLVSPLVLAVPFAELAVGVTLLSGSTARWGGLAAIAVLAVLSLGASVAILRGRRPDCNCFGRLRSSPLGWGLVARNGLLAALAALVVWDPAFASSSLDPVVMAILVGVCALLGLQGFVWYALLRQNGRILSRLAAVEASLQATSQPGPHTLAAGTEAPYFSLPSLDAEAISLTSLTERGRPLLLAFIDAGCGPCTALLPRLSDWQRRGAEALTIAVVSPGDATENAPWAREHDLDLVLLQPGYALSELYGVNATPSALLIDAEGRIASPIAEGSDAIVELAESRLPVVDEDAVPSVEESRTPAVLAAAALAGGAATLAASGANASVAEAASPERNAIRALIDEAEPRLAAEQKALQQAMARYSSTLEPKASSRSAVSEAIAKQVAEFGTLYQAVANSAVTTQVDRDAQRLVLETIQLNAVYLTKLDKAVRAKSESGALRLLRASRKAYDDSLQRGINAQAALTQ